MDNSRYQKRCLGHILQRALTGKKSDRTGAIVSQTVPNVSHGSALINKNFSLQTLIYSSYRSSVYLATCKEGGEYVVKMGQAGSFSKEFDIYSTFHKVCQDWGIGRVLYYGVENGHDVLAMDYLGPSLAQIVLHDHNGPLPITDVVQIAFQLLYRLETFHNMGFVHGNIEPGNLLIGRGGEQESDTVFLIDFANTVAVEQRPISKQKLILSDHRKRVPWRFASVAEHDGKSLCKRDDLESLMYVILFMCKRTMPWDNAQGYDWVRNEANPVRYMKSTIDPYVLFDGLPIQFVQMYEYIKQLEDSQKPMYYKLRDLLANLFETESSNEQSAQSWKWDVLYFASLSFLQLSWQLVSYNLSILK